VDQGRVIANLQGLGFQKFRSTQKFLKKSSRWKAPLANEGLWRTQNKNRPSRGDPNNTVDLTLIKLKIS